MDFPSLSNQRIDAGLYLVATPIGNLADMSLRALEVLKRADVILAEDTRVAKKLLSAFGLSKPLVRADEHDADNAARAAVDAIQRGQLVALVSDAGCPAVADPGAIVAAAVAQAGLLVVPVAGASAAIAALMVSGFHHQHFHFLGFVPTKEGARTALANHMAHLDGAVILFETAPRLLASLAHFANIWPQRPAVVARELTKLYEEVRRGTLSELASHYAQAGAPKGEIVLVFGPWQAQESAPTNDDLDSLLRAAMATHSIKDAADLVAAQTGQKRKAVYQRALALKAGG